jgi:tripartite motif-containing protein 71
MFDATGKYLLSWGTAGRQDDQFQNPSGIIVDREDRVHVLDSGNARVQKFEFKDIIPPPAVVEAETLPFSSKDGKAIASKQALIPAWTGGGAIVFQPKAKQGTVTLKVPVADSGTYEVFISLDRKPKQGIASLSIDGNRQGRRYDGYAPDRTIEKTSFGVVTLKKGKHDFALAVVGKDTQSDGYELTIDSLLLVSTAKERFLGKWGKEGEEEGEMLRPRGLAFDGKDSLYVADTGNNRIQKFSLAGRYQADWGELGSKPGQFNTPYGVAARGSLVYVPDWGNNRVQKFSY